MTVQLTIVTCRDCPHAKETDGSASPGSEDYRIGARAEAERCNQLLAERNRARNETIAALEKLEAAERALAAIGHLASSWEAVVRNREGGETKGYFTDPVVGAALELRDTLAEEMRSYELVAKRAAGLTEAKMLTPDDVRTIAREVIAEVAGRAQCRLAHDEPALLELAEAAKDNQ